MTPHHITVPTSSQMTSGGHAKVFDRRCAAVGFHSLELMIPINAQRWNSPAGTPTFGAPFPATAPQEE
jgi:hypothetical protein